MTEANLPGPQMGPLGGGTELAISAISGDGSVVVRLSGELDLSTAPRAEQALVDELGAGARTLIVDLRSLDFCDAAGLRAFVRARRRAQEIGAKIRLVHPNRLVRRVVEIAELGWLIEPARTELPGARTHLASVNP
jgi:anti-sigma B factor antagonist